MKLAIILLLAIMALRAEAREPERETTANGETVVREFYDDDSLKTVSHLDAKGKLLGTLYYAPKGIPQHLDFFDDQGHVTGTQTFTDHGRPIARYHFDEHGTTVFVETFTYTDTDQDAAIKNLVQSILLGAHNAEDPLPATDRMKFLTPAGNIGFTADGAWAIIALQPNLPFATVGFQIKNPADENTSDSTNFSVSVLDASSDEAAKVAKKKLDGLLGKRAVGKVTKSKHGDWARWSYASKQEKTPYMIFDAYRKIGGVMVEVRLGWPKLSKNPKGYDAGMEATFVSLLDSVAGEK